MLKRSRKTTRGEQRSHNGSWRSAILASEELLGNNVLLRFVGRLHPPYR
eukprot:COSAG04_NODE_30778_length_260_cov_1.291925_1_plen_48_part_10